MLPVPLNFPLGFAFCCWPNGRKSPHCFHFLPPLLPHQLGYQSIIYKRKTGLCAHAHLSKTEVCDPQCWCCVPEITDGYCETLCHCSDVRKGETGCTQFYKVIGVWNWTMKLFYYWECWQDNICKAFGLLGRQVWAKYRVGLIIDYLWEGGIEKQRPILLFWHILHSALCCNYFPIRL